MESGYLAFSQLHTSIRFSRHRLTTALTTVLFPTPGGPESRTEGERDGRWAGGRSPGTIQENRVSQNSSSPGGWRWHQKVWLGNMADGGTT